MAYVTGIPWREAMTRALYGDGGFFVRPAAPGSAGNFRTSASASPLFAAAVFRLITAVDRELGHPDPLRIVDVGAGRGQLLRHLASLAPEDLARRMRLVAVELSPRPADLPPDIGWRADLPPRGPGVLIATEWLDNIALDIAEVDEVGRLRYVLVEPDTGVESLGGPLDEQDAAWATRWWKTHDPGVRVELGAPRDAAWAAAVGVVTRGLAMTVDYGHLAGARPVLGSLAGFRDGWAVEPVPDGARDLTVHIAVDAVRAAGEQVAGGTGVLMNQREALRALGLDGGRPPLALASSDPAGYVRALADASAAAELLDTGGLGGHFWLLQPVGIGLPCWT